MCFLVEEKPQICRKHKNQGGLIKPNQTSTCSPADIATFPGKNTLQIRHLNCGFLLQQILVQLTGEQFLLSVWTTCALKGPGSEPPGPLSKSPNKKNVAKSGLAHPPWNDCSLPRPLFYSSDNSQVLFFPGNWMTPALCVWSKIRFITCRKFSFVLQESLHSVTLIRCDSIHIPQHQSPQTWFVLLANVDSEAQLSTCPSIPKQKVLSVAANCKQNTNVTVGEFWLRGVFCAWIASCKVLWASHPSWCGKTVLQRQI